MIEVRSYIDGQFVGPVNNEWLTRTSLTSDELVVRVPDSDLMDLVPSIQAANKAFSALAKQSLNLTFGGPACAKIADEFGFTDESHLCKQ